MCTKAKCCKSDLIKNSSDGEGDKAHGSWEREEHKSKRECDYNRKGIFEEMTDAPVTAVVLSNYTSVVQNHSTSLLTIKSINSLLIDECV